MSVPDTRLRARRTLWLIAAAVIAPVVLSYAIYYLSPRDTFTNYGELLPTRPITTIAGTRLDGRPFRLDELKGRWAIVVPAGPGCAAACIEQRLHATRQARTMQGRDRERVERVLLVAGDAALRMALLDEHPELIVARARGGDLAALARGSEAIYLVDPLGNQVLAWPHDPDIKALARDLARLLKASRIG